MGFLAENSKAICEWAEGLGAEKIQEDSAEKKGQGGEGGRAAFVGASAKEEILDDSMKGSGEKPRASLILTKIFYMVTGGLITATVFIGYHCIVAKQSKARETLVKTRFAPTVELPASAIE